MIGGIMITLVLVFSKEFNYLFPDRPFLTFFFFFFMMEEEMIVDSHTVPGVTWI